MRVIKKHEGERGLKGNGAAVCVGLGSALCQVVQGRCGAQGAHHQWQQEYNPTDLIRQRLNQTEHERPEVGRGGGSVALCGCGRLLPFGGEGGAGETGTVAQ